MIRSFQPELLDDPAMPQAEWERAQCEVAWTGRSLGYHGAVLRALRGDPRPVRRVLDVGCGSGDLMHAIRRRHGAEVVGVDLRAPRESGLRIMEADAVKDPLPACDVAVSVLMAHHLSHDELVRLIHNVGRSARRFLLLDLVRHRVPLAFFRAFAGPFLDRINLEDGVQSIRRAFTAAEMRRAACRALDGAGGSFRHSVSPFWVRQTLDIRYRE